MLIYLPNAFLAPAHVLTYVEFSVLPFKVTFFTLQRDDSFINLSQLHHLTLQFDPLLYPLEREWSPVSIISHIFPENFIEIPQIVQKIWRFSP